MSGAPIRSPCGTGARGNDGLGTADLRTANRPRMSGARARMKTILVPTEQSPTTVSALDTALLLARKFDSCIEGFPLRPAVADLVAMDPDSGLTMVAVKENDAEMVR